MYINEQENDKSDLWSEKYNRADPYWGEQPSRSVVKLRQYLKAGKVADLGAGEGRNAIYLARAGFTVLAVDNSPSAISKIKSLIKGERIQLETKLDNLVEWKPEAMFDGFVCHGVLHFLHHHEGISLIRRMQSHNQSKGAVSVSVFTSDIPSSPDIVESVRYLYSPGELDSLFEGWQIVQSVEEIIDSAHGETPHKHSIARLFAIRP